MKHFSKWELTWGSFLGPLFFLLYINDLPKIISDVSKPILFTDDTSIIITNSDPTDFKKNISNAFIKTNNRFETNLLSLNFDKTHCLQFIAKNSQETDMHTLYENKWFNNFYNTKFLRLIIHSSLSWIVHSDELTSKLNKACDAIRLAKLFRSLEEFWMIYLSCVHSVIPRHNFWGDFFS